MMESTLVVTNDFADDEGIEFSDVDKVEVSDGSLSLVTDGGEYSTEWIDSDLAILSTFDVEGADIVLGNINGWEKVTIYSEGTNDGEVELWERHYNGFLPISGTPWTKLGEVIFPEQTFYLTHIEIAPGLADWVQFRVRMKSDDGTSKCYDIGEISLHPITHTHWASYNYTEPKFPVTVTVGYESTRTFDLPILTEGDTPRITFRISQLDGEFVDLTNMRIFFKSRERYSGVDYLFDKECVILDEEYGLCEANLRQVDTTPWGEYLAELSCVYGDSKRLSLQSFILRINPKL